MFLLSLDTIYPVPDVLQFSLVRVETDLQDFLLLFEFLVGDSVLVD